MDCLFCKFSAGEPHFNGFPFLPIYETNNTTSFLSVPCTEDQPTHILATPKKHYELLEQIPENTQTELILAITRIIKILKENYDFNLRVQLNNGEHAEQCIPHVHFHIFPMKNQKQVIFPELKEFTQENFEKLSEKLQELFKN